MNLDILSRISTIFSRLRTQDVPLRASVFVCGAALMMFEMTGSRLLAPYVGTSTYVWTSIIGVILGCLSIGYWLGGKWADASVSRAFYARVIFVAALAVIYTFVVMNGLSFLPALSFLSIELQSVVASIILFAPASILLGIVSPYAVKLSLVEWNQSAQTVGGLYALSTLGSIAGTFFAGFYLIPRVGTVHLLFLIAGVLCLTSVLVASRPWKTRVAFMIFLVMLAMTFSTWEQWRWQARGILEVDTDYARVKIVRGIEKKSDRPVQFLITDPFGIQSGRYLDGEDLLFNYTKFYRLSDVFTPAPMRALMIGGCGYSYPRTFLQEHPMATLDVVEIDPGMTELAKKYFGLSENPRLHIVHEDGRTFLNRSEETYDVIFNDAFNASSSVPFQLTTKEALAHQARLLADGGVVVTNLISALEGEKSAFFQAAMATYQSVFPSVRVFLINDDFSPEENQNVMIVASKTANFAIPESVDATLQPYVTRPWSGEVTADALVLTDRFAPVEFYKKRSLEY